jgi:hypothetical protein
MAASFLCSHGRSRQRANGELQMGEEEEMLTLVLTEVVAGSEMRCGRRIRRRRLAGPARSRGGWRRLGCSSSSIGVGVR